uniref:Uncharacterized protein n=1 Tax=Triticum urartu TaxID=4572 RepID=A0A8R7QXD9_TRIUA
CSCEGRKTAGHGLDDSKPKSLIESRLHKGTLGVTAVTVELSITDTVHLGRDPADMAIHVVLPNKVKHLLELRLLLLVL